LYCTPGPCSEYRQLHIGAENSDFRGTLETLRDALYKSTTTTTTATQCT